MLFMLFVTFYLIFYNVICMYYKFIKETKFLYIETVVKHLRHQLFFNILAMKVLKKIINQNLIFCYMLSVYNILFC